MDEEKYSITHNTWNKIADLYQEHFMDLEIYNGTYDAFCELLPSKSAVLEIGCGPGNITKYLAQKRPDLTIDATDVAPNMLSLGKKNVPSANFFQLDCRDLSRIDKVYNGIMMGFALPYLSKEDLEKFLVEARNILSDKGIIYISCIEGEYQDSKFESGSSGDKTFVYYYSDKALKSVFAASNYSIVKKEIVKFKRQDGSTQNHLIYIINS